MGMLKQSGVRNKYKGFEVKHVVQIFLLLALCTWLLNQARQSYEIRKPVADAAGDDTRTLLVYESKGMIKLGRKDLDTQVEMPTLENIDVGEEIQADEEIEENKNDETDQEKTEEEEPEEAEDLIDEDDRDWETQVQVE